MLVVSFSRLLELRSICLGLFTIRSLVFHIDESMLSSLVVSMRLGMFVLSKVNILVYHISLDRIPTRRNLDKRGIDL